MPEEAPFRTAAPLSAPPPHPRLLRRLAAFGSPLPASGERRRAHLAPVRPVGFGGARGHSPLERNRRRRVLTGTRNAIRFLRNGRAVELADFAPPRRCSTICAFRSAASAPRRAARRAIAAPARSRSGGSGTAGSSTSRSMPASCSSARRTAPRSSPSRISPTRTGCTRSRRRWSTHHGSQCGFCTPGIVMSLFALYQEAPRPVTPRGGQRRARRKPLPLHRLSADRRRGARGLRGRAAPTPLPARRAATAGALARGGGCGTDLFVGDAARFFAAPASEDALARLYVRPSRRDARRRRDRCRPLDHQGLAADREDHLARPRRGLDTIADDAERA